MTVFQFAIYRYARSRMTPAQAKRACELAKRAEAGDLTAVSALMKLVNEVLSAEMNQAVHKSDENREDRRGSLAEQRVYGADKNAKHEHG